MKMDYARKARSHTRCSQIYRIAHHALLIPSILVPPVVSIFDEEHVTYTVIAAALATAVSLTLSLDLRAHRHERAAREYWLMEFDARQGENVQERARQALRDAPFLPWCCARGNAATRDQGETT